MDFEELREKYKSLALAARLTLATLPGMATAAYFYFDQGAELQEQLVAAEQAVEVARTRFESARKKKANLPILEEQLAFTEEQLVQASKNLPETFVIEDVLQKTATIAHETGVKLLLFSPLPQVPGSGDFLYMEKPIKTEIVGHFAQITGFFDKIVHLESSVYLRGLSMKSEAAVDPQQLLDASLKGVAKAPAIPREQLDESRDDEDSAEDREAVSDAVRQDLELRASFDLVVYRAMTDAEVAEIQKKSAEPGAKDGNPEKGERPINMPPAAAGQQEAAQAFDRSYDFAEFAKGIDNAADATKSSIF